MHIFEETGTSFKFVVYCRTLHSDPCLPANMNYHLFASNISLVGTGDYFGCRRALKPLLSKDTQDDRIADNFLECCEDTLYELPANFTVMPFYGFSEFWYSMNDVLGIGGTYRKTLFDNRAAVSLLCCVSIGRYYLCISLNFKNSAELKISTYSKSSL